MYFVLILLSMESPLLDDDKTGGQIYDVKRKESCFEILVSLRDVAHEDLAKVRKFFLT